MGDILMIGKKSIYSVNRINFFLLLIYDTHSWTSNTVWRLDFFLLLFPIILIFFFHIYGKQCRYYCGGVRRGCEREERNTQAPQPKITRKRQRELLRCCALSLYIYFTIFTSSYKTYNTKKSYTIICFCVVFFVVLGELHTLTRSLSLTAPHFFF